MSSKISYEEFYDKQYFGFVEYCRRRFGIDRYSAEDIVQNAFSVLWKRWNTIEWDSPEGVYIWMRKTVKFMSYSFNRHKSIAPVIVELQDWLIVEEISSLDGDLLPVCESAFNGEVYGEYVASIRKMLSPGELGIFDCIIVECRTARETASILNMNVNAVNVALRRLRTKLKNKILPAVLGENNEYLLRSIK